MYRAVVTIAGIYGTFPEGDPVAGVSEPILKSWLDAGIIAFEPESAAEAFAYAPESAAEGTFEPVTFEPDPAPFYPEARPFEEAPAPVAEAAPVLTPAPKKAGRKA